MKYNKKLIFLVVILFMIFISGCSKKSDYEILNEYFLSLYIPASTTNDLDLDSNPMYLNKYPIQITWNSSNQKIITSEGKVFKLLKDEIVEITATATLNSTTETFSYEIEVPASSSDDFFKEIEQMIIDSPNLLKRKTIQYSTYNVQLSFTSNNENVISNDGKINYSNTVQSANIDLKLAYRNYEYNNYINITIDKLNNELLEQEINNLSFPKETNSNINLPREIIYLEEALIINYASSNNDILSKDGIVNPPEENTQVTLTLDINGYQKDITIKILSLTVQEKMERIINSISIPNVITSNIILSTSYGDITATWSSSDTNVLTNDGQLVNNSTNSIKLSLILSKGTTTMNKDYNVKVLEKDHMFIDRSFEGTKSNVHIENGKLVLNSDSLEGFYETNEINVQDFIEAVGSYSATSSTKATCEYMVKVKSNNTWSKYLSYGVFGLGLHNGCHDQADQYVKLSTDEIMLVGSNVGTAFQIRINLKRESLSDESPKVALLALAILYKDYTFTIDKSLLLQEFNNDVPKLYQHDVPEIGGSICSITSSTMLLKWKGHDFSDKDTLEHRYIAGLFKDYGNNIFGNWSYNSIGMGSFGDFCYVGRFYTEEELCYHLQTVGPVSASIKGTTISNKKTYNTNGHLIVVTGFKLTPTGTIFYIKDPNVYGVAVEMTSENFYKVYRNVSYVIE